MKIILTSISGIALSLDTFDSVSVTTLDGTITVLPGHEPIISALKPGILEVIAAESAYKYAIGGGVIQVSPLEVRVLADMIEDGGHDLEAIKLRKSETEAKLVELRKNNDSISIESYIELEQEYLKDAAREQFAQR